MDYSQLPSDLRQPQQQQPLWYWSKRGDCINVSSKKRAKELLQQGTVWRRVNNEEIKEGTKPGSYNPVYDVGDGGVKPIEIGEITKSSEIGDELSAIEI